MSRALLGTALDHPALAIVRRSRASWRMPRRRCAPRAWVTGGQRASRRCEPTCARDRRSWTSSRRTGPGGAHRARGGRGRVAVEGGAMSDEETRRRLMDAAIGRLLRLGSRPAQPAGVPRRLHEQPAAVDLHARAPQGSVACSPTPRPTARARRASSAARGCGAGCAARRSRASGPVRVSASHRHDASSSSLGTRHRARPPSISRETAGRRPRAARLRLRARPHALDADRAPDDGARADVDAADLEVGVLPDEPSHAIESWTLTTDPRRGR